MPEKMKRSNVKCGGKRGAGHDVVFSDHVANEK